jgi:hypothetical protein
VAGSPVSVTHPLTETREQFVGRLSVVPSLAFESYVKGIQTADLTQT